MFRLPIHQNFKENSRRVQFFAHDRSPHRSQEEMDFIQWVKEFNQPCPEQ